MAQSNDASIRQAIAKLAKAYGPQGWWPVECERRRFIRPNGDREREGYHPREYDFPRTEMGRFEICCGAVLTQNTAWTNVQKALAELRKHDWLSPARLLSAPETRLSEVIRPAGYFNQKSRYLRSLAEWFHHADQQLAAQQRTRERLDTVRPQLLAVRGVGPETADSILLYAYGFPTFVVDTYTRRVFGRLGVVDERWDYERIRSLLGRALEKATVNDTVEQYQEAHALIVEHAKRYHGRNSNPVDDFLL